MATQFTSKALEANLAETRYRDIYIPPEQHQEFIQLANGYFGIKKTRNRLHYRVSSPFVEPEVRNRGTARNAYF